MKTVKQIAEAYNVSKQTIHRIIHKNGLVTIADGNRVLIPDDSEEAIYKALEALQSESGRPRTSEDETRTDTDVRERSGTIQADDQSEALREVIAKLEEQVEELRADKAYLQERLTKAEQERESLTKERQTILAELLELRKPKVIEVTETKTAGTVQQDPVQRPAHHPRKTERQQPTVLQNIIQGIKNRFR